MIRVKEVTTVLAWDKGEIAQEKNWKFIERRVLGLKDVGISIAGCSITSLDDVKTLEDMGCTEIGLGAIVMTNPWLVRKLKQE